MGKYLDLDFSNKHIEFKQHPIRKESYFMQAAGFAIAVVAWPMLYCVGIAYMIDGFQKLWHSSYKWDRLPFLNDEQQLSNYALTKLADCTQRVSKLRDVAIFDIEALSKPDDLNLPIPKARTFLDNLRPSLPKEYWKKFDWSAFARADFTKVQVPECDADRFTYLRREQLELDCLSRQISVLGAETPNRNVEAIKNIAMLSFVKSALKERKALIQINSGILLTLPVVGPYLEEWYRNDNTEYESFDKKFRETTQYKHNLGLTPDKQYKSLVEAHNDLVDKGDYQIPLTI
jgi:hypothetical protein